MTHQDSRREDELSLSELGRVHHLCVKFESAWQDGRSPRVEEFLSKADSNLQPHLLRELLLLELEYRRAEGDHVGVSELNHRFPRAGNLAAEILATLEATSAPDVDPGARGKANRFPFRLNCPHCHNPIVVVEDGNPEEIECPSCGSSFQLDPDRTVSWSPEKLPKIDKFQLLEAVGRGAFGTVYRARDTELDRIVAVKVPRSGSFDSEDDELRFIREARNAGQLTHPGIVPVYEVGHSELCPYIVSEFVQGVTLSDALTARRYSAQDAAQLVLSLATALDHAHRRGVFHRDLKPSNIMLESIDTGTPLIREIDPQQAGERNSDSRSGNQVEGTDQRPRIMDFGLARRDDAEVTMTIEGQILGTPAYMSPEQARGEGHQADNRSDIYSLGVILFELLTGERPFRGNSRMLVHQVLNDEPPSPRKLNQCVSRDLETITLKCMQKRPGSRYQSMSQLAEDLNHFLNGEPITARPVSSIERCWRWCRRRPAIAGLCITITLLVVALSAVPFIVTVFRNKLAESEKQQTEAAIRELYSLSGTGFDAHLASLSGQFSRIRETVLLKWRDPLESDDHRIRLAALILDESDLQAEAREFLLTQILQGDADSVSLCRLILRKHSGPIEDRLWDIVDKEDGDTHELLRAASGLALFCPDDERWQALAPQLAGQLMTLVARQARSWAKLLVPVRKQLGPALEAARVSAVFSPSERLSAVTAICTLWGDDHDKLLDRLVNSSPVEFREFLNAVRTDRPRAEQWLMDFIEAGFHKSPPGDFPPKPLVEIIESAKGLITREFAICQTLPLSELEDLCAALSPFGFRPIRCRPYVDDSIHRVAAIWHRDGVAWQLRLGLTTHEALAENEAAQSRQFEPVDAAGYFSDPSQGNALQFAVLWRAREEKLNRELILGTPHRNWQSTFDAMRARQRFPVTIQFATTPDDNRWRTQIVQTRNNGYAYQRSGHPFEDLLDIAHGNLSVYDACMVRYQAGKDSVIRVGFLARHDDTHQTTILHPSTPEFHVQEMDFLIGSGFVPSSVSVIRNRQTGELQSISIWQRSVSSSSGRTEASKRQATAAIALFLLGNSSGVSRLLSSRDAPTSRSFLVNGLRKYGVPVSDVVRMMREASSKHSKRALLLCVGDCSVEQIGPGLLESLVKELQDIYTRDPDAGVHSAAEWTLRQWKQPVPRSPPWTYSQAEQAGFNWFVNGEGISMAIIRPQQRRGGVDVVSPAFAISTTEISNDSFMRFEKEMRAYRRFGIGPVTRTRPAGNVTWFQAAAYCNWLSRKEGISEEQFCYQPNEQGRYAAGMRVRPDASQRAGYRLPTVREWRIVSTSTQETEASWFFGNAPELLNSYCRGPENSMAHAWESGMLRPTDDGLFDILGNMAEYFHPTVLKHCQRQTNEAAPQRNDQVANFTHVPLTHFSFTRELGTQYESLKASVSHANTSNSDTGFRVVRTLDAVNR